jgi:hypothetical protein
MIYKERLVELEDRIRTHAWTVLNFFLLGDDPILATLREQALVSEWSEFEVTWGSFSTHFSLPPDAPTVPGEPSCWLNDVIADFPDRAHVVMYSLYLKKGKLCVLAGIEVVEDTWPDDFSRLFIGYCIGGEQLGTRHLFTQTAEIRASCRTTGS